MKKQPRWMRLDNAAKIYPAARRRSWNNIFRLSVTLNEEIDNELMQKALTVVVKRFPSIAVKIRRGIFWYYLEEIDNAPEICKEYAYPLSSMSFKDIKKCAFRVITYKNRVAVEFYHAVTDGNGGLVFIKTLVSEYLKLRYNVGISCSDGVLDVLLPPQEAELEDSFLKNDGLVSSSRKEATAYKLRGTIEPDGYLNLITGILKVDEVVALAKKYGVSVTVFIASVMIKCIINIQNKKVPNRKRQKPVKIVIPVNLRKIFNSNSLRNFALYVSPGVDPKMGDYPFEDIVKSVYHQMGFELTRPQMAAKITTNVKTERMLIVKILPLFIKNFFMKLVFNMVGERKACLTISNLGMVTAPDKMCNFLERMDFILGRQATCVNNCGIISFKDKIYINLLRTVKEAELEREFFRELRKMGLNIKIESNRR